MIIQIMIVFAYGKNSYICWKMICLHVGGVHDGGFYKYGKWRKTVVVWKQ